MPPVEAATIGAAYTGHKISLEILCLLFNYAGVAHFNYAGVAQLARAQACQA